jgi:hypothetical protein
MTVPSQVSTAEMREAFRLNLTSTLIWKLVRGNARILIYLIVFLALVVAGIANAHAIDWREVSILTGLFAMMLAVLVFSLYRTVVKTAKIVSKSAHTFSIDNQGLSDDAPNGTRIFVPWSAINRWREGKLVFTIGDERTFRTIPKGPLGEAQSGELRSLLLSQVR